MLALLRLGLAVTLALGLIACGGDDSASGSGGGGGTGATGGSGGSPPIGSRITGVQLTAQNGASEAGVVTFAQAFRPGDAAEGVAVTRDGDALPTQVDVKRRHADGSIRHAVLSVELPALSAGETLDLDIKSAGAAQSAAGPDTATLLAGGLDTRVEITEGGKTYTASAADALAAAGASRFLDGDLVSELRALAPPTDGGSEHPALGVQFDVRFFAPDRARVSVSVENTWSDTPGNRSYDVQVKSGGNVVYEKTGVDHFHHARWRRVLSFGAAAPDVFVRHDLGYLISTGALPNYDLARTPSTKAVSSVTSAWDAAPKDILDNGLITKYFPTTGGRDDIGPLPKWAAVALLSGDPNVMAATMGVGDLAGGFSVHYRDRKTGRAISIDDYPTISLIAAAAKYSDPADKLPDCANCDSPYTVDDAHQPSLVYVPYLLTGDSYYLDELYFWTSYNFISQNYQYRQEDLGLLESLQVRAQAWSIRTLLHAAWLAPDDDKEKGYLTEKVQNNISWYMKNAVDSNAFGWWQEQSNWDTDGGRPDENMDADVRYYTSPWQSDFLVWTWDSAVRMGFSDAQPIHDWFVKFTIGRYTNGPDYNPYDGSPYHIATSSVSGTPYATWAELWQKSFANRAGPAPTTLEDKNCALCYSAIARVALSSAARAKLDKAETAYDFVDQELRKADSDYDDDPTWAVVP